MHECARGNLGRVRASWCSRGFRGASEGGAFDVSLGAVVDSVLLGCGAIGRWNRLQGGRALGSA